MLTNNPAQGDAWTDINLVGFDSPAGAFAFVNNNFHLAGNAGHLFSKKLGPKESYDFDGDPWIVFYYPTKPDEFGEKLLSVTQCAGSLDLSIGSWGRQLLLTAA